jgi:hypothetical protein
MHVKENDIVLDARRCARRQRRDDQRQIPTDRLARPAGLMSRHRSLPLHPSPTSPHRLGGAAA